MGATQALKRIPRIKFPQRHPKSSGDSASQVQATTTAGAADLTFFFTSKASTTVGGKASLQPKRTPMTNEEMEAIMLGGCF